MEEEIIHDDINILDYLIVLAKRKNLIIAITLTVSVITAVYSLLMPKIYKAETRIISVEESKGSSFLLREFSNVIGLGGNAASFNDPNSIISVIRSRTIYDKIINRFSLMEAYETESMEKTRSELDSDVITFNDKVSSIISISVLSKEPQLAADMANAFVEEVQDFLKNIAITEASKKRIFFEKKLKQTREDLIRSEEAMRDFQEKTGLLHVEDQAKAVIESIAEMRAQIAVKEVEIKVMKTYSTANNPDLQIVQEELAGLKTELKKLETKGGDDPNPLMPMGRLSLLGTDYIRILRDLKFNEGVFEFVSKQYEMARIEEAKDSAIIQVIDKAVVPEKKFKPQRSKMVLMAALTSFLLAVVVAFLAESFYGDQHSNEENRKRIATLKKYSSFKRGN